MLLPIAKQSAQYLSPLLSPVLEKIPFSLLCGSRYRKLMRELREPQRFEYLIKLQERKLISYVNDSINRVPYYKTQGYKPLRFAEEIFELPVIGKETLQEFGPLMVDPGTALSSYEVGTGGTSGKQTTLKMSNSAFSEEWAFVANFLRQRQVNINSRRLSLRGIDRVNGVLGYNPLYKEQLLSPFHISADVIQKHSREIKDFQPLWIHGYPSSVYELAKILKNLDMRIESVRAVLLVSERTSTAQKALIEEVLGPVLTFYGQTERVAFAEFDSSDGRYHVNLQYGFTEALGGEVVSTGFLNKATRLIRYRTGDAVDSSDGRLFSFPPLEGRWGSEALIGIDGQAIRMTALNSHDPLLFGCPRYQFKYIAPGLARIHFLRDPRFEDVQAEKICELFQGKTQNQITFDFRHVEQLELTPRGKHKYIVGRNGEG